MLTQALGLSIREKQPPMNPDYRKQRDQVLAKFRKQFGQCQTQEAKIALLREMSCRYFFKSSKRGLQWMRARFDAKKGKYFRLEGKCKVCRKDAGVRHHVIALQNGGGNQGNNLIRLCFDCHAEIHPWLKVLG